MIGYVLQSGNLEMLNKKSRNLKIPNQESRNSKIRKFKNREIQKSGKKSDKPNEIRSIMHFFHSGCLNFWIFHQGLMISRNGAHNK